MTIVVVELAVEKIIAAQYFSTAGMAAPGERGKGTYYTDSKSG
jgi:hypothetical protein